MLCHIEYGKTLMIWYHSLKDRANKVKFYYILLFREIINVTSSRRKEKNCQLLLENSLTCLSEYMN